jgi:hypothetical protein
VVLSSEDAPGSRVKEAQDLLSVIAKGHTHVVTGLLHFPVYPRVPGRTRADVLPLERRHVRKSHSSSVVGEKKPPTDLRQKALFIEVRIGNLVDLFGIQ